MMTSALRKQPVESSNKVSLRGIIDRTAAVALGQP
jgi:hypothetical protein